MTTTTQAVTAEELLRMPDDGYRYELIRGEVRRTPPTGYEHGRITVSLTAPLAQHVRARKLGTVCAAETGFLLASNPDLVRAPDAAFIRRERVEEMGPVKGYWPGAPDLAVEVISPEDSYADVQDKVFDWLEAGTRMVIVVNPRRRVVTVYRSPSETTVLTEDDTLDGGDVVPGWRMPVREVFEA